MKSRLWISSFDRIWCCKQASPYPRSLRFFPMSSSRIFMVLCLTFRSVIHFELTHNMYKVYVWGYFFACRNPVPFIEQTIFAPLYSPSFVKDRLTIGIYFCILYCVISVYLSILFTNHSFLATVHVHNGILLCH